MKKFSIIEKHDLEEVNSSLAGKLDDDVTNGQELAEGGKNSDAVQIFLNSWNSLPEPKKEWALYSNWISSALCEAFLNQKDFVESLKWAQISLETRSSEVGTREFIRLGKVCFEMGAFDQSNDWFKMAFDLGGKRAFQGESSKYLKFYLEERTKR